MRLWTKQTKHKKHSQTGTSVWLFGRKVSYTSIPHTALTESQHHIAVLKRVCVVLDLIRRDSSEHFALIDKTSKHLVRWFYNDAASFKSSKSFQCEMPEILPFELPTFTSCFLDSVIIHIKLFIKSPAK